MSALLGIVAQAGSLLYRRLEICERNIFSQFADCQSALHELIS
jgi:hypothetical protein